MRTFWLILGLLAKICTRNWRRVAGKGRRLSFDRSAAPQSAEDLYDRFVTRLRISGLEVQTGKFRAMMQVRIENDGLMTLLLEKEAISVHN